MSSRPKSVAALRRTGCGKTLAFVLPIVQRLLDGNQAARPERGRAPRVIVLAPTRELAKQVLAAGILGFRVWPYSISPPCTCLFPQAFTLQTAGVL